MKQRHPKKVIQSAIMKYEAGAKLSALAREYKVNKSTLKYWLDNAPKFIGGDEYKSPIVSRLGDRLSRESWEIVFSALKELKEKLFEMPGRDLVFLISELLDLQSRFGVMGSNNMVPEKVIAKSEEVRITVQRYLQKQNIPTENESKNENSCIETECLKQDERPTESKNEEQNG